MPCCDGRDKPHTKQNPSAAGRIDDSVDGCAERGRGVWFGGWERRLSVRLRAGNPKPYDEYDLTGMQEIDVEQYRYEAYEWDDPVPKIPPLTDEELKAKTKAWQRKYLLDEAVVSPTVRPSLGSLEGRRLLACSAVAVVRLPENCARWGWALIITHWREGLVMAAASSAPADAQNVVHPSWYRTALGRPW